MERRQLSGSTTDVRSRQSAPTRAYFKAGPKVQAHGFSQMDAEHRIGTHCRRGAINVQYADLDEVGLGQVQGLSAPGQCERAHAAGQAAEISG